MVPEPEHRNHISSKKAAGTDGKKLIKLCYSFVVSRDDLRSWMQREYDVQLGGVWVYGFRRVPKSVLPATYSLLTRFVSPKTGEQVCVLDLITTYLDGHEKVMYTDLYGKAPNQWRTLFGHRQR